MFPDHVPVGFVYTPHIQHTHIHTHTPINIKIHIRLNTNTHAHTHAGEVLISKKKILQISLSQDSASKFHHSI